MANRLDDDPDVEFVDYGDLGPTEGSDLTPPPVAVNRERFRGLIGVGLVALLGISLIGAMLLLWHGTPVDDIQAVVIPMFSGLVGIVGAVTGFYFGSKQRSD